MGPHFSDADDLIESCKGCYDEVTEYQLFSRCIAEQTIVDDDGRRLRTKEDGGMDSNMMQNPSDPDATYRSKAGKEHRGYVANLEESVGSAGTENIELAASKNIELVPTDLTGRDTDPIMADFRFNEDYTKVLECPAGHAPKTCSYNKQTEQCTLSFERDHCANCPFQDQCKPKIFKRVARKTVSRKSMVRARYIRSKNTDRFKQIARLRDGVETIPSILKNRYDVNKMPARGLQRSKFFFGGKIAALNFKKLIRFRDVTGHYAPNPISG